MAENKRSFLLYCDLIHTIKELSDEEAGKLFKHILAYVNDENPTTDDRLLKLTFEPIKQALKRDLDKWEKSSESRSIAGKIGNLKKYNPDIYAAYNDKKITLEEAEKIAQKRREDSVAKLANANIASQNSQDIAKLADNVSVSVSDSVSDNVSVSVSDKINNNIFSADAEILKEDSFPVNANTPNGQKKKTTPKPPSGNLPSLHHDIIAAYEKFYEGKKGFKPQLLGSDFAGVKNLRTFFKRNNTPDDQALALFTAALDRYNEWGAFERKQSKLHQICSNFQLIIDQLKNPTQHGKQTSKYTPDFSI